MCSVFQTDDERPTFRPFTRESLAKIEARIQEHNAKTKDLERKRAEGEVRVVLHQFSSIFFMNYTIFFWKIRKHALPSLSQFNTCHHYSWHVSEEEICLQSRTGKQL